MKIVANVKEILDIMSNGLLIKLGDGKEHLINKGSIVYLFRIDSEHGNMIIDVYPEEVSGFNVFYTSDKTDVQLVLKSKLTVESCKFYNRISMTADDAYELAKDYMYNNYPDFIQGYNYSKILKPDGTETIHSVWT